MEPTTRWTMPASAIYVAPADARPLEAVNLFDLERQAAEVLSATTWDYYAGGAEDELTVAENIAAFRRIKLRPRMLQNVQQRNLSTTLFGDTVALPVLTAPTAFARLAHPDAELAVARATTALGTIGVYSTLSHYPISEIATAGGPFWAQLYCFRDRAFVAEQIALFEQAGARALVLTVDANYPSRRERHLRVPLHMPDEVQAGTLQALGLTRQQAMAGSLLAVTWDDVAWMRGQTKLPFVIKGILTGEDALLAAEHGADGVVVSNHGGRQIDGAITSVEALPEVADAVGDRVTVLLDSGIRRGTDILKALALGARAVLIGRPYLWGLALGGEAGVRQVLSMLYQELDNAMAQCGVADITALDRRILR